MGGAGLKGDIVALPHEYTTVNSEPRDNVIEVIEEAYRALYFSTALLKGFMYGNYSVNTAATAKAMEDQLRWNARVLEGDPNR